MSKAKADVERKGAHMDDHHQVDPVHHENRGVRLDYLCTLYSPRQDSPEVFRTPGSFLAEYVFNVMPFDQIVTFVRKNPRAATGFGCMDERINAMRRGDRPLVTSHDGCGAAGLVMKAALADTKVMARLAKVLDQTELEKVLAGNKSDELGKLWSKTLAKAAGADYTHLGIDCDHHYTTMAVIDAAGCFLGETPGEVGERSFIVSNTEFLGNQDQNAAYELMIQYGFLALDIARGDHSILHGKDREYPFTIVVTRDTNFNQARFDRVLKKFLADKKQAGTDYGQMNYRLEYLDEAQLAH